VVGIDADTVLPALRHDPVADRLLQQRGGLERA